jgi:hypothetical protein
MQFVLGLSHRGFAGFGGACLMSATYLAGPGERVAADRRGGTFDRAALRGAARRGARRLTRLRAVARGFSPRAKAIPLACRERIKV